jgi:hypothetical protein
MRGRLYQKYIYDNPYVEGEYRDTVALHDIYLCISRTPKLRKILNIEITDVRPVESILDKIRRYVEIKNIASIVEDIARDLSNKVKIFNINPLDILFLYILMRDYTYIDLMNKIYRYIADHWYREDLIGYYTAIHGGGGASRFVHWVLALDLIDRYLDHELRDDLAYMLNEIGYEIYKITNVWDGNWEFSEAAGLLAISAKMDSINSHLYREKAIKILGTLQYTFLDDGGSVELAAGYHHYDLESIVSGAEILYYLGSDPLYRHSLDGKEPLMRKALLWLWNISTPYNTAPAFEDTNEFHIPSDLYVIVYLRYGDDVLGYIEKTLRRTKPYISNPLALLAMILENRDPVEENFPVYRREKVLNLDPSGRFVYRESEDPDSFFFILDYGPHGAWHGHPDKLSFEVYRRGEAIIVDSGSGGYYDPQHWTWNRGSVAHNTITRGDQDHDEVRGEILGLSRSAVGAHAVFRAKIYGDITMVKEVSIVERDHIKEIDLIDEIMGNGIFRWNLHARGSCRDEGLKITCKTGRNTFEIISSDEIWPISQGLRGSNEKTNYIYREKSITGKGTFKTKIIIY